MIMKKCQPRYSKTCVCILNRAIMLLNGSLSWGNVTNECLDSLGWSTSVKDRSLIRALNV